MFPWYAEYEITPPLGRCGVTVCPWENLEGRRRHTGKLRIVWLNERIHEFPGFFNLLLRSINSHGFQVSSNWVVSVCLFVIRRIFSSGMVGLGWPYIQEFDLIRVVINNLRVKSHSSCSIYLQQVEDYEFWTDLEVFWNCRMEVPYEHLVGL